MANNIKWDFPSAINGTLYGSNNAAIETFRDHLIDSLTREILQNSLDAKDKASDQPVHVKFNKTTISHNDIPDIEEITEDALPKAYEFWKEIGNKDTLRHLERFDEVIHSDEISVLKISDYNTTGLLKKNFNSLIAGDAYSEKPEDTASGSKGIGKAAPFAASDLRMVFYSSHANDNEDRSAGILNFVSFNPDDDKRKVTQAKASYMDYSKEHIDEQITFNHPIRTEETYGTDIFILGFKDVENWDFEIKLSTLENFLVALYQNKISVDVNGQTISKENLNEIINELKPSDYKREIRDRIQKIMSFYEVLTSPDTKKFEFDERFEKYDFINSSSDGVLLILEHEPANRTVLQTRIGGMKIYERNRISGNINFSGIFQAIGDDLNSYLRDMENPNHNDWSVDRIDYEDKKEKKIAENLLTDFLQWYKSKVKESFEEEIEDQTSAFGVESLLPILSEADGDDSDNNAEEEDSGISVKIKSLETGKKKKDDLPSGSIEAEEEQFDRLIDEEEGTVNPGDNGTGLPGGPSGQPGDGENTGGKSTGGSGGEPGDLLDKGPSYRPVNAAKVMNVKIIEQNSDEGSYKLVGKFIGNFKKIALDFNFIDARGYKEKAKLLDVSSEKNSVEIKENKMVIEDLTKNETINASFKVNSDFRIKMRVDTYEVSS